MTNAGFPPPPSPTPLPRDPSPIDYAPKAQNLSSALGSNGIRLFQFRGITVFLHWSWFVIAFIQIQGRRGDYTSIAWNIAEYLTLFLIVLLHEFGHAFACRSVGGFANRIMLWPLGGVAYVSPPPRPGAVFWSILAGPLVNVALCVPLFLARNAFTGDLGSYIHAIFIMNLGLLIFNMLPIYPLDGGQIFQSLLWFVIGRTWSLIIAASVGLVSVALLILFGLYLYTRDISLGIWPAVFAAFLGIQAWAGLKIGLEMRRRDRIPRRTEFACPACGTSPPALAIWQCPRCSNSIDIFGAGGLCPHCGTQADIIPCVTCGQPAPFVSWRRAVPAGGPPADSILKNPNPAGFGYGAPLPPNSQIP